MNTTTKNNLTEQQMSVIELVCSLQPKIVRDTLIGLVHALNLLFGVSFMSVKNYRSKKSKGTERANYTINVGANYEKMKEKSGKAFMDLTFEDYKAAFETYPFDKKHTIENVEDYKKLLDDKILFETCRFALANPVKKTTPSNDIWIVPKILVFNTNTLELSIFGQSMSKEVKEKSEEKPPKPRGPETVCKGIIGHACKGATTTMLSRFCIGLLTDVKAMGKEWELDCEHEYED